MLAAIGLLIAVSRVDAPIRVGGELCHPQNLLVKYRNVSALALLEKTSPVVRVIPEIRYAVVRSAPGYLLATKSSLTSRPGVEHVDLDRCALPAYDPNDEYWPQQWDMRAIRANNAWDTQKGSPDVAVAVIDTGVFVGHPDLADNVWVNSGEIPDNGIDDDGDGYVDDVNGYDFSHDDGNPDDVFGHGTACSGLVAAVQDNAIGVSGVAPHCKIMALKAATDSGYFYDSNNVPAYIYAADHHARVLSMSFFSDRVSQSEKDALQYCWDHGVLPVAAAGNASSVIPFYPGGYDHVLSVAAVDGNLNKAGFSNYGSWVDVSAPGTGLYTTTNDGGYTSGFAGTSGACPHVAGVAALCFSEQPNATPEEVMDAIEDTATVQSQDPYGEFSLYGLVNAEAAVARMDGGAAAPHPPVVRYMSSMPMSGSQVHIAHIRGRGLDGAVTVICNGRNVPLLAQSRNDITLTPAFVSNNLSGVPCTMLVNVGGTRVATLIFPPTLQQTYPLNEASSPGATVRGDYSSTLSVDGHAMVVTRRSDGAIQLEGTFHFLGSHTNLSVTLRRRYTGTSGGTETVQLYDWSSASYPYGNFVTLGSGPEPTSYQTTTYTIGNAQRFVDPEGTAYLLITTSADQPAGAQLELDMCYTK